MRNPYQETIAEVKVSAEAVERSKGLYQEQAGRKRMGAGSIVALTGVVMAAAAAGVAVCFGGSSDEIRRDPADGQSIAATDGAGEERQAMTEEGEVPLMTTVGDAASETIAEGVADTHSFTLGILSAEGDTSQVITLERDKWIPLRTDGEIVGWALGWDGVNAVNYVFGTSFYCEGEGIDLISYAIEGDDSDLAPVFQVVEPSDASIILEGHRVPERDSGSVGGEVVDADGDGEGEMLHSAIHFYDEITLDYDCQQDEQTWVNICGDRVIANPYRLFGAIGVDYTVQDECDAVNDLLDGVEIVCTVTYDDGTTESATVIPGAVVMTNREAGYPENDEHVDEEAVFLTYELR